MDDNNSLGVEKTPNVGVIMFIQSRLSVTCWFIAKRCFKFTNLCLICFFSVACSTQSEEAKKTEETQITVENLAAFNDGTDSRLEQMILTGRDSKDTLSYWSCDVETANSSVKVHVRFWGNKTGFSGDKLTSWSVDQGDVISIQYDEGLIKLANVNLTTNNGGFELSAVDAQNYLVNCSYVGPRFGVLSDGDSVVANGTFQLEQFISKSGVAYWACEGDGQHFDLTMRNDNSFERNGGAGKWFIDDQFSVVFSQYDQVEVWSNVLPLGSIVNESTRFEASSKNKGVFCSLSSSTTL